MAHTYHALMAHIVFSTKYRRPMIDKKIKARLYAYMAGIINNGYGRAYNINGIEDHIHILAKIKPAIAPSDVLRDVKSNSSRWVHETFPEKADFAWQRGYGIFAVSQSQFKRVYRYIERQEIHHRKQAFKKEFINLLESHEIEYKEDELWD